MSPSTAHPSPAAPARSRWLGLFLAFLATLPLTGCTAIAIAEMLLDPPDTKASFAIEDGQLDVFELANDLERLFDVQTELKAIETGLTTLKIIGAYKAVLDAINWLLVQGLVLLATNAESQNLLEIVLVALLK